MNPKPGKCEWGGSPPGTVEYDKIRANANRRGVALLLCLGVLSLLMMMVLSFSYSAINNQASAQLQASLVRARLQAESTVQTVYADLSLEFSDPDDPRNIFPATKPGDTSHCGLITASPAWNGRYYWISTGSDHSGLAEALSVDFGNGALTPSANAPLPSSEAGWNPLQEAGTGSRLVGRVAYLLIDQSGMIDPSPIVGNTIEANEPRKGISPEEINLKNILTDPAFAEEFQQQGVGNGSLPAGQRWFSYRQIFNRIPLAQTYNAELCERLFPISYDVEAFHTINDDKHRFDLKNAEWDNFHNDITASGIDADAGLFYDTNRVITTPSGGIPWLHHCPNTNQKNQIIANLIDYSDSDNIATTDNAANPTYVGLEQVPYINEILFAAEIISLGGGNYNLQLEAFAELANIYRNAVGAGGHLQIQASVTGNSISGSPVTLTFNWNGLTNIPAKRYDSLSGQIQNLGIGGSNSISNLTLTVTAAKLTDSSGNLWDFSRTNASAPTTLNVGSTQMINVEVNDPRDNLDADQWTWGTWAPFTNGTLGARNAACTAPAAGPDNDDEIGNYMGDGPGGATDEINISTAFIRNAPMESLWELGAIHRGTPWQTINLKTYNETAGNTGGLGAYTAGDANILDQVKLTDATEVSGRINSNTYLPSTFQGLFGGVTVGGAYDNPGAGTSLSIAQINQIIGTPGSLTAGELLYENGSDPASATDEIEGNDPFRSRAEIATATKLSDGSVIAQPTDASQEEIIGKVIALTTVRSNLMTLIVTAQTIKDLPTNFHGGTRGVYDPGVDIILAEQKIKAVLYRDGFSNSFRILRYEYLDE